ncbi:MAG TPA: sigma 54-interacting transcriptional regulator [Pirellulaceae bacterium]|nr:sigma 54-interacting transcriptional regulator [Pirellulaceae bacterium]
MAYLYMQAGGQPPVPHELAETGENLLGRDWQCRIVIQDPQSSRIHASIHQDDEGWWITDRQSSNGTVVNGQILHSDSARLLEGTEIYIGETLFTFTFKPMAATDAENEPHTATATLIFNRRLNTRDYGQYTLDFLPSDHQGQDFFFLFKLSVKLLEIGQPDDLIRLCLERLYQQTKATAAGMLWLNDDGQLKPRLMLPDSQTDTLTLRKDLTKRVVLEKQAIRVEYESDSALGQPADAICVPLIRDEADRPNGKQIVQGAIHLYRLNQRFLESHVELACATANLMMRALRRADAQARLEAENQRLASETAFAEDLVGGSPQIVELKSKIARVAKAAGSVLIRGESGSGKELVARAIHRQSPRADRPLLTVNCAAIPRELMESQLFGHRKGAFTSADRDHVGWFQQADRGTLLLDEIGELTLEGQAKLLRILDGHPFMPIGASEQIDVDVRVICATNRDLAQLVQEKRFREDLYYRLTVYELMIPPLRERGADIALLVDHFLTHFRKQHGRSSLRLSDEAKRVLVAYHWPGNVRQLRNVIDSAVVMAEGNEIREADLGIRDLPSNSATGQEPESLRFDFWEKRLIEQALARTSGSMPEAAQLLGISRATLYRKIEDYQISRTG